MRPTFFPKVLLILPLLGGCAALAWVPLSETFQSWYSAKSITFTLVDEVTGQPIEGAIVTANWQLATGSFAGGDVVQGNQKVMETVSTAEGKVHFPAWGPEWNKYGGHIKENDPQMFIYKVGYEPARLYNWTANYKYPKDSLRVSMWDGQVAKLKVAGSYYGRGTAAGMTGADLGDITYGLSIRYIKSCDWTHAPRMTVLLISKEGPLDRSSLNEASCGTLEAALKGIQ